MTDADRWSSTGYREAIASSLTPVRPLTSPSRRVWTLVPLGLVLAATAPVLNGQRGDLELYAPVLTWGVTALQSVLGLWILALGFREAVPGRNVSRAALVWAVLLTTAILLGVTLVTNAASPTATPIGRAWQYWAECIVWPTALGAPFMTLTTLLAARAFPTRPSVTGALCGTSAGVLTDSGWRLSCWMSEPLHIIGSHGFSVVALAGAGALLATALDARRWSKGWWRS